MLTSALPASAVNPITSSYNGATSAPSSGTSEAAPDGFARMLDQASKPDATNSPDRDTDTEGNRLGNDSAGSAGRGGTAEAGPNEASPATADVRSPPWTPGPRPIKGQHPPITPIPGHLPVRLPPVPGDEGTAGTLSDSLMGAGRDARAKGQADASSDAGSGLPDTAAASLAAAATPPPAPTPDSASALLATLQAGAAAAAQALAGNGGPEQAGNDLDSDSARASGSAAISALATNPVRLGQLLDGTPDTGPDAGRGLSLASAGGARLAAATRSSESAGRAEPLPPLAGTLAPASTPDGTAVQGLETDRQPDAAAGPVTATLDTATQRRSATAENATPTAGQAALQAATQTARQAASPSAGQMAIDSAARNGDAAAVAAAGNNATTMETGRTGNNANGTGPNAVAGAPRRGAIDAKPEAGASRAQAAAEGSARSDVNSAANTATSFNAEARAYAPTPAHADQHGGVAAATAQAAASAALASAAGAAAREAGGSLSRSAEAQREGTAATAGAGSTGGLPSAGALAWITGAAGGAPAPAAANDGRIAASPGSPDFAPQLAAHISTFVQGGVQHARLELNPGEMGPLTVQIQLDGNAARVHLAAEHAGTRAALEQAMPQLAGSLRENGLTLSGGGVFEQPRPQQQAQAGDGRSGNNSGGSGNDSSRDSRGGAAREAATSASLSATAASAATGRRHAGVVDLVA